MDSVGDASLEMKSLDCVVDHHSTIEIVDLDHIDRSSLAVEMLHLLDHILLC